MAAGRQRSSQTSSVVVTAAALWWYKTRNDPTAQKKRSLLSYLVTLQTSMLRRATNVNVKADDDVKTVAVEEKQSSDQSSRSITVQVLDESTPQTDVSSMDSTMEMEQIPEQNHHLDQQQPLESPVSSWKESSMEDSSTSTSTTSTEPPPSSSSVIISPSKALVLVTGAFLENGAKPTFQWRSKMDDETTDTSSTCTGSSSQTSGARRRVFGVRVERKYLRSGSSSSSQDL
jgi:hypothetical protein